jgi:hypothetical protein
MGYDVDWGSANPKSAAGGNAGVDVLPPAGNDDGDNSDEPADDAAPAPAAWDEGDAGGGGATAATGPRSSSGGAAAAAGPRSSSSAAAATMAGIDPADADAAALSAAIAAAGIEEMPDLNDFTTWHPGAWGDLEFDKSPIPADPNTSICSVSSYLAQAMIMWYHTAVRERNAQAWDRLNSAWKATFHTALTAGALETWPTDGPHGFSEPQSTWLTATLRYLKGNGRAPSRRLVSAAPPKASVQPPPAAKPASRTSTTAGRGEGASRTARNPDPVQATRRLATDRKFNTISLISHYFSYFTHCSKSILLHLFYLYQLLQIMTMLSYYIN